MCVLIANAIVALSRLFRRASQMPNRAYISTHPGDSLDLRNGQDTDTISLKKYAKSTLLHCDSGIQDGDWRRFARCYDLSSFPTAATDTGDGPPAAPPEQLDRECLGCRRGVEKHSHIHNRVPGACKYPDVETIHWDGEACKASRPRNATGDNRHSFEPGQCRHAATLARRSGIRASRHPRPSRVPAVGEPTMALPLQDLEVPQPAATEDIITDVEPPQEGASSSSSCRPTVPPRGRGPDQGPRDHHRPPTESSAQTERPTDWTTFDVKSILRQLRVAFEGDARRLLRKLHLRWWHASAGSLDRILRLAGVPNATLKLIPSIVDTCRVCRTWTRPAPETVVSHRMIVGFNVEVECDLMFYRRGAAMHTIVNLVCRGTRWQATGIIDSKSTSDILDALDTLWIAVFGPMGLLFVDGEVGLDNPEAEAWFQIRGIHKRTAAVKQHIGIADRRGALLRGVMHKIETALTQEGITMPLKRVLAEATFCLNCMLVVNGATPYNCVLGRQPPLLPDLNTVPEDDAAGTPITSRHSHRLREVAVAKVAEGTAIDRLNRANRAKTQPAGEIFEYKVGDEVEYWRDPSTKEASGWRAPGYIEGLSQIAHGKIAVRTSTDRVISCRIQDVRPRLAYACFFLCPDLGLPATTAVNFVVNFLSRMKQNCSFILGTMLGKDHTWITTPDTAKHRELLLALKFFADNIVYLSDFQAVRVSNGVHYLPGHAEFATSQLYWWHPPRSTRAEPMEFEEFASKPERIDMKELIGAGYKEAMSVQYLMGHVHSDIGARRPPQAAALPLAASEDANTPIIAQPPSLLPSIPEGSQEGSVADSDSTQHTLSEDALASFFDLEQVDDDSRRIIAETLRDFDFASYGPNPRRSDQDGDWRHSTCCYDLSSHDVVVDPTTPRLREYTDHIPVSISDCVTTGTTPQSHSYLAAEGECPSIAFENNTWKLLPYLPRQPSAEETVVMTFHQGTAAKVSIETRGSDLLTPEEVRTHVKEIAAAMLEELKLWVFYRCFSRKNRSTAKNIIDSRWVLKWKVKENSRSIRARLTVRGFLDHGSDGACNFSGTASRWAQRLVVSESVLRSWPLVAADIRKAFLQGITYEELAQISGEPVREVNFTLPRDSWPILRMIPGYEDFDINSEVLHCEKPGTGLREAPRCFSLKFRKVTQALGLRSCSVEPELEMMHRQNKLVALLCKHIDDVKITASADVIKYIITGLEKVFGALDVEWNRFTNCGIRHHQLPDFSEVRLDQVEFLSAMKPIMHPEVASAKGDTELSAEVVTLFVSLLMTLAYALITRMDLAIYVAALQKVAHKPCAIHARRLNVLVRWAQKTPKMLIFKKMRRYPDTLCQVSDSAFHAEENTGLSMRGLASLRCNYDDIVSVGKAPVHVLDFVSKSQRHVTRSTFASELFAATDSADSGFILTLALHEVNTGVVSPNEARLLREHGGRSIKLVIVLDALSVHAAIAAAVVRTPAEQSLLVHLLWIKAALVTGAIHALIWVDTRSMCADGLTKGAIDRAAIHALMDDGNWHIDQPPKVYVAPEVTKVLSSENQDNSRTLLVIPSLSPRSLVPHFAHNIWR